MSTTPAKPPEILDKIVDIVLSHRIKSKTKAMEKRRSKAAKGSESSKPPPNQYEQSKKARRE